LLTKTSTPKGKNRKKGTVERENDGGKRKEESGRKEEMMDSSPFQDFKKEEEGGAGQSMGHYPPLSPSPG
jgi:hypothetical protein